MASGSALGRSLNEQIDGQRGEPGPATDDRDTLKQPANLAQAPGPGESVAGENDRDQKDGPAHRGVERPAPLISRGEPAGEHEAGRQQRGEPEPSGEVVKNAMQAGILDLGRGSRWITGIWIGDEQPRTQQTNRIQPDEQWSPGGAVLRPQHTPRADSEGHRQQTRDDEVEDLDPAELAPQGQRTDGMP